MHMSWESSTLIGSACKQLCSRSSPHTVGSDLQVTLAVYKHCDWPNVYPNACGRTEHPGARKVTGLWSGPICDSGIHSSSRSGISGYSCGKKEKVFMCARRRPAMGGQFALLSPKPNPKASAQILTHCSECWERNCQRLVSTLCQ